MHSNIDARSPNVAVQGFCAWAMIGLGAHNALIRASADVVFNFGSLFHRGWKHWSQLQQPQNHESPGFGSIRAPEPLRVGWIAWRPMLFALGAATKPVAARCLALATAARLRPKGLPRAGGRLGWPGRALSRAEMGIISRVEGDLR